MPPVFFFFLSSTKSEQIILCLRMSKRKKPEWGLWKKYCGAKGGKRDTGDSEKEVSSKENIKKFISRIPEDMMSMKEKQVS